MDFFGFNFINDSSGTGVTEFIQLIDVPNSYIGQANKFVQVRNDESGLQFTTDVDPTTYRKKDGTNSPWDLTYHGGYTETIDFDDLGDYRDLFRVGYTPITIFGPTVDFYGYKMANPVANTPFPTLGTSDTGFWSGVIDLTPLFGPGGYNVIVNSLTGDNSNNSFLAYYVGGIEGNGLGVNELGTVQFGNSGDGPFFGAHKAGRIEIFGDAFGNRAWFIDDTHYDLTGNYQQGLQHGPNLNIWAGQTSGGLINMYDQNGYQFVKLDGYNRQTYFGSIGIDNDVYFVNSFGQNSFAVHTSSNFMDVYDGGAIGLGSFLGQIRFAHTAQSYGDDIYIERANLTIGYTGATGIALNFVDTNGTAQILFDGNTSTLNYNSSLYPVDDNTYDLGFDDGMDPLRWRKIYGVDMYATTFHGAVDFGFTQGSVPFADNTGVLVENNGAFTFDNGITYANTYTLKIGVTGGSSADALYIGNDANHVGRNVTINTSTIGATQQSGFNLTVDGSDKGSFRWSNAFGEDRVILASYNGIADLSIISNNNNITLEALHSVTFGNNYSPTGVAAPNTIWYADTAGSLAWFIDKNTNYDLISNSGGLIDHAPSIELRQGNIDGGNLSIYRANRTDLLAFFDQDNDAVSLGSASDHLTSLTSYADITNLFGNTSVNLDPTSSGVITEFTNLAHGGGETHLMGTGTTTSSGTHDFYTITVPDACSIILISTGVAEKSDGTAGGMFETRTRLAKHGGTLTIKDQFEWLNIATGACSLKHIVTSNNVKLQATGISGNNMDWKVKTTYYLITH